MTPISTLPKGWDELSFKRKVQWVDAVADRAQILVAVRSAYARDRAGGTDRLTKDEVAAIVDKLGLLNEARPPGTTVTSQRGLKATATRMEMLEAIRESLPGEWNEQHERVGRGEMAQLAVRLGKAEEVSSPGKGRTL